MGETALFFFSERADGRAIFYRNFDHFFTANAFKSFHFMVY